MDIDKERKNVRLIVFMVLLAIIIVALVGYIVYDKGFSNGTQKPVQSNNQDVLSSTKKDSNNQDVSDDTKKDDNVSQEKQINLKFDSNNCINNSSGEGTYRIGSSIDGIDLSLEDNKKEVSVSIDPSKNPTMNIAGSELKTYRITNFSKEVVDVTVGGFGQSTATTTLLFLMEDGTVEYTPLWKSLTTNPEQLKSFGTLKEVNGVIKFLHGSVYQPIGGGVTTFAQKSDGSFYDLYPILEQTGNYRFY